MDNKFRLIFELVPDGDMYRAKLNVDTPHGPLHFDIPNRDAGTALRQVLKAIERTIRRKSGRKPRNYRQCQYVANLLNQPQTFVSVPKDSKAESQPLAKGVMSSVTSNLLH